ncbi:hypothetical protein FEDK69T_07220 [Flavobacterium enshiense DK69]|uniref:Uncharacterized protein n=1 Tax=Flavobacterium enshiense DK69 TaxID=1107311 RepID=V6SCF0_9FLAO|nr:hypothetical protein [Flavobacterium enshiense]ESU24281.1 hypothetical protein FEDK69T_07220 [Flavobacterium enshiense DK69]KGO95345.1 hypothetical protein Q767_11095 [Flavobacterium enshiense DK69]
MKNKILVYSIGLLMATCGTTKIKGDIINQKLDVKSGKEIVLVKVINDSRCPEGVECVWAGEVMFEVAAYENGKVAEQVQFTLNKNTSEAIKDWFVLHLPESKKGLKTIEVLPYPKDGVKIRPEEYYIKLVY